MVYKYKYKYKHFFGHVTHPERITEAVVRQHDGDVFFLSANGNHKHSGWTDKGLEPGAARGEKTTHKHTKQ